MFDMSMNDLYRNGYGLDSAHCQQQLDNTCDE